MKILQKANLEKIYNYVILVSLTQCGRGLLGSVRSTPHPRILTEWYPVCLCLHDSFTDSRVYLYTPPA